MDMIIHKKINFNQDKYNIYLVNPVILSNFYIKYVTEFMSQIT